MIKYPLVLSLLIISSLQGMQADGKEFGRKRSDSFLQRIRSLTLNISQSNQRGRRSGEFHAPGSSSSEAAGSSMSPQRSGAQSHEFHTPREATSPQITSPRPSTSEPMSPRNPQSPSGPKERVLTQFNNISKLFIARALATKIIHTKKSYDPNNPNQVVVTVKTDEDAQMSMHFPCSHETGLGRISYSSEDIIANLEKEIRIYSEHPLELLYEDDKPMALSPKAKERDIKFFVE